MAKVSSVMSPEEVAEVSARMASKEPQEVLAWALGRLHPSIAISSSFGAEDVVLIDMAWRINPQVRVFTLDTLRLPTETYTLIDQVKLRYGMPIEVYYPKLESVSEMVEAHGFNLFYKGIDFRKLCCGIRKVEPVERALKDLDAWVSGLRRDQIVTRATISKVELDEAHPGKVKINPLADWTWEQVWGYIKSNQVPYNSLHDQGFPSIGCDPCTRAVKPGEDPRAGRWWWESDPSAKECGLHVVSPLADIKLSVP